jgi:hypothetical protein
VQAKTGKRANQCFEIRITVWVTAPDEDDVATELLQFLPRPELVREVEGRLVAERNKSHSLASGRAHIVYDGPLGACIEVIEGDIRRHPASAEKPIKGVVGRIVDEHRPVSLLQLL